MLPNSIKIIPEFICPDEEIFLAKKLRQFVVQDEFDPTGLTYFCFREFLETSTEEVDKLLFSISNRIKDQGYCRSVRRHCSIVFYLPGGGCRPHTGRNSVPNLNLSLLSPAVLEFSLGESRVPLLMQPRQLTVTDGDALLVWKHEIPYGKVDAIGGAKFPRGERMVILFREISDGEDI
ncbi:hypothetical protein H6F50_09030 [Coleofasciculus sp. FACHB-712]|uniref:hypothetical protein n=1 Tax=Coleofasciculus sp. FACHB-712 TaxID=2692789 RepID=UPI001682A809|nr:hypothetical protein [Coleofasciculus sp. FACHB-712]MBD1942496.1 hypothetical protein [Coleofasciculus sp. FACHB-712]